MTMEVPKPKHIVCCALPAWEADYSRSTVELMQCLAVGNKVLYVDFAYTITDLLKGITGKKKFDWKRLLGINKAVTKLEMHNLITFNSFQPFLGRYWKITGQEFSVYYIYDDFSNVAYFKGFTATDEAAFITQADLVIVSSAELKKRRPQIGKPIEVVNNGVRFAAFNKYANEKKLDQKHVKTVGYTGTIDSRLDINLLEGVVKDMPGTRFLFIGKVMDAAIYNCLLKYINVCFEPPVPVEKVPLAQSQIDVGIVPYVCNALTAAIYPLKVNEYLAMGLPVVMTPFASIGAADELIYTANTPDAFKHYLEAALSENDIPLKEARIAAAEEADWQMRAGQLMDFITFYQARDVTQMPN